MFYLTKFVPKKYSKSTTFEPAYEILQNYSVYMSVSIYDTKKCNKLLSEDTNVET